MAPLQRLLGHLVVCLAALPSPSVAFEWQKAYTDHLSSTRPLSKRFTDESGHYNISLIHINDVHAHLDEFRKGGSECTNRTQDCRGGIPRLQAQLKALREKNRDSLFLNAGDEFQGTMFFKRYGYEKIVELLADLNVDALALGNHEWDCGDEYLGKFVEAAHNVSIDVVACNIKSSDKRLARYIKPYKIFPQHQLAVIGATTTETPDTTAADTRITKFEDVHETVQAAIDEIRNKHGIKRIVALTHIGYEEDKELAKNTTGLYLILGGHSHSKLGNDEGAVGPYPTTVKNKDGEEVFIGQAWRWSEHLGHINVRFDADGKVVDYVGGPIHLTNDLPKNHTTQARIDVWNMEIEKEAAVIVGRAEVELDQSNCDFEECTLGNFITDVMVASAPSADDMPTFGLTNSGGIRSTIPEGDIRYGSVENAFPFENNLAMIFMNGSAIWDMFEGVFSEWNKAKNKHVASSVQVSSEVRVVYNSAAEKGNKLVSVHINDQPLDMETNYRIMTNDFVADGKDNIIFPPFRDYETPKLQENATLDYLSATGPVFVKIEGRIKDLSKKHSQAEVADESGAVAVVQPSFGMALLVMGLSVMVVALGY